MSPKGSAKESLKKAESKKVDPKKTDPKKTDTAKHEVMVKCPECERRFELEEGLDTEDVTYCPGCDIELEILSVNPPKVRLLERLDDDEEGYAFGADDDTNPNDDR
jgi:acetyl-CoA carboxylase beta subunit